MSLAGHDLVTSRGLKAVGVALVALGTVVIAGRFLGHRDWVSLVPDGTPMAFMTALSFVIVGLGFAANGFGRTRVAQSFGVVLVLIGLGTLALYLLAESLSLAAFVFQPGKVSAGVGFDGRMAPSAAGSFAVLGLILILLDENRPRPRTLAILASLLMSVAFLSFCSYLVGLKAVVDWWRFVGMAVHTAVGLMAASAVTILWIMRRTSPADRATARSLPLFATAGGLILVVGMVSYVSHLQLIESANAVMRAHEVRGTVDRMISEIARMESSARGFALTTGESFRRRVHDHKADVDLRLLQLDELVRDDPDQVRQLVRVRELVGQKYTASVALMETTEKSGQQAATKLLAQQPAIVGSSLVNLADEIRTDENEILALREGEMAKIEAGAVAVQQLAGAFAFALVVVAFALEFRASAARARAEKELRLANETLEQRVAARTAELQTAVDQLVERERSRRFLADSIPQLVWTTLPEGPAETFNRSWCDYTGLSEHASKANGWVHVLHPDDVARTFKDWQQVLETGSEGGGEYRLRRARDGEFRWFLWWARPERGTDGQLLRWVGTSTDVHDQRKARAHLETLVEARTAELANLTRLQRAVLDGTTFSVVASDRAGIITEFNRGAEKLLGYTRAEMIGRPIPAFWHLATEIEARAAVLSRELGREITAGAEVFTALAKTGRVDEHEWTYVRKDGTHVPVLLSVSALWDERGRITGFLGTAADLTGPRAAEAALKESEARFRSSFDSAGIGMAIVGLDGRWVQVNQTTCEIVGYPEAELLLKTFQDITHPDDLGADLANVQALLDGRIRAYQMEKRYFHRDGHVVWINLTASLVRDGAGAPVYFVAQIEDISVRKQLEQALRDSEARLNYTLQTIHTGGWELDLRSHTATRTREHDRIFGYESPLPEWTYEKFLEHVLPEDRPEVDRLFQGATAAQIDLGFECRIRRVDGEVRWIWATGKHQRDETGQNTRMSGIVQDITDRKWAESALRDSEARLARQNQALVEFSRSRSRPGAAREETFRRLAGTLAGALRVERASIWLLAGEGLECQCLFVATGAEYSHGLVLATKDYPAYFQALDTERMIAAHTAATDPRTAEFTENYLRPLGITAILDAPIRLEGRTVGVVCAEHVGPARQWELDEQSFVGSVADLVQIELEAEHRRQAEAQLRASEERLSNVFRAMADGLMVQAADGAIVAVNGAAERILGLTRAELMGLAPLDARRRSIRENGTEIALADRPAQITLRTGQSQRNVVMGVHKPDGTLTWISINSEPIFAADGKVTSVVVSFADVTERKHLLDNLAVARDQALEGSRLKSEFLASMSHEIRTPMNGVMGMASLLLDTPLNPEQREMGVVIQNSAESLLTIINDILDFSKIEAGKLRIEPVDFDLRSLVEDVLTLLAPRAHEKHLELLCEIDDRLNRSLRGDAGRIRQVLLNLAGNAVKFTAAGEVLVAARWLREHNGRAVVRLEVTDTGIGITAIAQRQLFQPFVQADGSTTRRFGGTGLGLAISRQLVELMGGEIGFQSEEGRGSTFWVQLDLEERSATAKPRTLLAPGRRILVVDANIKSRRILTGHLAALGVQAVTASDAAGTIDTLLAATAAGQPYELVLLDHHLPDTGGLGLAREIRAQSAIAATPLILLAATNAATDSPPFAAAGFAAQLTKPVREEQLYRALFRVLEEAPAPVAVVTPSAAPDAQTKGAKLRMLVAEDNSTNQIVTRKFLERLGHTVDLAADGTEALAQLARQSYDVVLMDCQMPGMDGYSTTKHIRSGELAGVNPRIPVIALTAYAMPADRQKCLDAGMDEYVAKPLRVVELTEALRRCGLQVGSTTATAPDLGKAAESELLDPKQLEQLRSLPGLTAAPLLNDLIHLFLAETPAAMSRLGEQLDRRAAKEIAMTAHKLAGSCANLGARDLRLAALAIEKAARAEDWKEISSRVAVADREWLRLKFHLERLAAEFRS